MQTAKEISSHPHIAPCVTMWSVTFFFFFFFHLLNVVHAYATSSGKAKWSGPDQRKWEENEFKFHNVTCYINCIVSHIHVDTSGGGGSDLLE